MLETLASELAALASLTESVRARAAGPQRDLLRHTLDDLSAALLESSSLITERAKDIRRQRSPGSHPYRTASQVEVRDAGSAMKTLLRRLHAVWLKTHRVRATSALPAAHDERLKRVGTALLEQTSLVALTAAQIAEPPSPRERPKRTEMEFG